MRSTVTAVIALGLAVDPVPAFAQAAHTVPLVSVVETVREKNPEIAAAAKRWEAALARVPQSKSLEDPQISLSAQRTPGSPFSIGRTPASEQMLTFSQFLPFFGKLPLKGKMAAVDAQIAAADYKRIELDTVDTAKQAYFDLFINYKEEELNRRSMIYLQGLAKVAEARYASSPDMPQADILKIDLEIARLKTTMLNLAEERAAKQARMNYLMGNAPDAAEVVPEALEDVIAVGRVEELYKSTLVNEPELLMFQYAIERNRYATSLAKKSVFPDFTAAITKRGLGLWDLMLSFTVPLWYWTKQKYEIKEAVANLEEAEAAYAAMTNKALAETKERFIRTRTAYNKISLYKQNLLPLLESSIASSQSAYQSGKGDFMALLDSQRMLIDTRLEYYRAVAEFNMAVADLERETGSELRGVRL